MQDKIRTFIEKAHQKLKQSPNVIKYLKSRGVSDSQIEKYEFGFLPSTKMGISDFDKWSWNGKQLRNKVIFPIKNSVGKYKAIGTRLAKSGKGEYSYFYFDRTGANFYGYENLRSIWKKGYCYLTEGVFDHYVLEHVFDNCLCALAANLKSEHLRFLRRFVHTIVLAFDADQTGVDKVNELIENQNLGLIVYHIKGIRRTIDSNIKDLNGLWQTVGPTKFKNFIKNQNNLFLF